MDKNNLTHRIAKTFDEIEPMQYFLEDSSHYAYDEVAGATQAMLEDIRGKMLLIAYEFSLELFQQFANTTENYFLSQMGLANNNKKDNE